ncbi:MAG: ParE family toxin-like protein [Phycisphaerae bacterium]
MIANADPHFWNCYNQLPTDIQRLAKEIFDLWQSDPFHPSLHFKQIHPGLWSARININYRALARRTGDHLVWFWIGTHAEYDRLLNA